MPGGDAPRLLGKALSWDSGGVFTDGTSERMSPSKTPCLHPDLLTPPSGPLSQARTVPTKRGIPLAPNVQPAPQMLVGCQGPILLALGAPMAHSKNSSKSWPMRPGENKAQGHRQAPGIIRTYSNQTPCPQSLGKLAKAPAADRHLQRDSGSQPSSGTSRLSSSTAHFRDAHNSSCRPAPRKHDGSPGPRDFRERRVAQSPRRL